MMDHLDMERILADSDLVGQITRLRKQKGRSYLFGDKVKPLSADQIARLVTQNCDAADWSRVLAAEGFEARAVTRTRFEGTCVLGRFSGSRERAPGLQSRAGIDGATLISCEVGHDALISDVGLIANCLVGEGAVISSVGEITAVARPTFGNGAEIALGLETGERSVRAFAELDVALAAALARSPGGSPLREAYEELLRRYLEAIDLRRGYIGPGAVVRVCHRLRDVFVGEAAQIEGADAIVNTTLLSNRDEVTRVGDGVMIEDSLIQWGCAVESGAIVQRSVLTEHSHAERHGKVTESLVGPNTGVAEGEVTASLLGPFVGFHHQALLIAANWPQGKGNIGYGANVGSNHTGKAPDQEIWPGEGMFFGLGVDIKFPANFERAPYTILATGVTTLPQRVEFPFSLINAPGGVYEGVSPAFNEIIPGWMLSNNAYALARNDAKFSERNRARRLQFEFEVLRPDTIGMVREARRRLQAARVEEPSETGAPLLYFEKDIPGLGKNYLLARNVQPAIDIYSFYLCFYGLRGLYRRLLQWAESGATLDKIDEVLSLPAETTGWASALEVLNEELPDRSVRALLELWVDHHRRHVEQILKSKQRDDARGARIIPDYAEIHTPAAEDKVIRRLNDDQAAIEKNVAAWLKD